MINIKMYKTAIIAMLIVISLASCSSNNTPEKYLSDKYSGYNIIKEAQIGSIKSFLLKNNYGTLMISFINNEPFCEQGTPGKEISGISYYEFRGGEVEGTLVVVFGENSDLYHTNYNISLKDYNNENNIQQFDVTKIKREISEQQYILDIYLFDSNYELIHTDCQFEDGTIF